MQDVIYGTISGEEHERLDKLDAERRAHMERLTQGERLPPNVQASLDKLMGGIEKALGESGFGKEPFQRTYIDQGGNLQTETIDPRRLYKVENEPGSPKPRPWRPEQHAADTFGSERVFVASGTVGKTFAQPMRQEKAEFGGETVKGVWIDEEPDIDILSHFDTSGKDLKDE